MKHSKNKFICRAALSGSAAGVVSALAASHGARKGGHPGAAAINAVSHCFWSERAFLQDNVSVRYTGLGAGIHLGSAIFWGVLFEALRGHYPKRTTTIGSAAATAVVAYVVDYHVVPERVTPGFDVHMTPRSLVVTYVALAVGFVLGAALQRRL